MIEFSTSRNFNFKNANQSTFYFNCLNAINLLIQKQENKKAGEYLNTFSRFIRMVLEMPKNETIELKELQVIEYYLKLEEKDLTISLNIILKSNPM